MVDLLVLRIKTLENERDRKKEIHHEGDNNIEHHDPEENHDISINYIHNRKIWNQTNLMVLMMFSRTLFQRK